MRLRCGVVLAALLWALPGAAQVKSPAKPISRPVRPPDLGSIRDGVYRNSYFHVTYKIPVSWVDRTQDMQPSADAGKGLVLLALFERPPEASGDTVNSAVVIAAEPAASYPGMHTAANYFALLTELATGKGFKVVNEPYAFTVGSRALVRGDFSKPLGQHTMQQCSLAGLERSYFLSITFIAGSEDECDNLLRNLSLPVRTDPHQGPQPPR